MRLAHWANVPLLVAMAGSGLQILVAYPFLGARGALFAWYPLQGVTPPPWLTLGGWLAGGRAVHFLCMWPLVLNGLVYVGYLAASGEWRRRLFSPRRDLRDALRTAGAYLRLRSPGPPQGLYNGLQRLAYTSALALGVVAVASGLALWQPVQLPLASLLGGYEVARALHLGALTALALFTVGHVAMVALHPRTLPPMITGGPRG